MTISPWRLLFVVLAGWPPRPDPIPYGSNIQPTCKSHCVKSLDLLATGRLWPESGTHAMGCGDVVHTIFKLLTHHDYGLG